MRRPGIDPPHVVACVRCRRVHEWFGYRREGGKDTARGFVCVDCLRKDRMPQGDRQGLLEANGGEAS